MVLADPGAKALFEEALQDESEAIRSLAQMALERLATSEQS